MKQLDKLEISRRKVDLHRIVKYSYIKRLIDLKRLKNLNRLINTN